MRAEDVLEIRRTDWVRVEVVAKRRKLGPFTWYGRPYAKVWLWDADGTEYGPIAVAPDDVFMADFNTDVAIPRDMAHEFRISGVPVSEIAVDEGPPW